MRELMIKVCGVTRPEDAETAIGLGADRVGMVMHSQAARGVTVEMGRQIARATLGAGGTPVAVFVDASAEQIERVCSGCGIAHVQLHGHGAIEQARLCSDLSVSLTLDAARVSPKQFEELDELAIEYLLFDHSVPGSGSAFDWNAFTPPRAHSWVLAGGLTSENVGRAIRLLQPHGVDVSSGVEGKRIGQKDTDRMKMFIKAVRSI